MSACEIIGEDSGILRKMGDLGTFGAEVFGLGIGWSFVGAHEEFDLDLVNKVAEESLE